MNSLASCIYIKIHRSCYHQTNRITSHCLEILLETRKVTLLINCNRKMAAPVYVEEELGRKWDKCLSDGLLKFGGGLVLGSVFSLLFFKRRRWPILMGGGFGIGMAYSNCEKDLNATIRGCSECVDKESK